MGDALVGVVKVVEHEALLVGPLDHLLEGVPGVEFFVVRVDGDECDAPIGIVACGGIHPAFPCLHVRAVVARLDQDEHLGVRVVGERMRLPVDSGKLEGRRNQRGNTGHCRSASLIWFVLGTGAGRPPVEKFDLHLALPA